MLTLQILTNQSSLGSIGCTVWYILLIHRVYSWPTKEHRHCVFLFSKKQIVLWKDGWLQVIIILQNSYNNIEWSILKKLKVRMAIMSDMRSKWVRSYPLGIRKPTCKSQVPSVNEMNTRLTHLKIYPTTKSPAFGRLKTLMTTLLPFIVYCTWLLQVMQVALHLDFLSDRLAYW